MSKEKVITLTKVFVAITLLWELYGPAINHNFVLLFVFPCMFYFAFTSLENKRYIWGSIYLISSYLFNPIVPVTLSHTTWILVNSFVSIFLLANIFSWYFLNFKSASLFDNKKYEEAEKIAIKAFEVARDTFGLNNSTTIGSFNDLIDIYKVQNKFRDAVLFTEDVLLSWKITVGSNNSQVKILSESLLELKELAGEDFEVKYLTTTASEPKEIKNKIPSHKDQKQQSNLIKIARSLVNTAFVHGMKHEFDEAEELMKYAVSICEEAEESSNSFVHLNVSDAEINEELDKLMKNENIINLGEDKFNICSDENTEENEPFYWPPPGLKRKSSAKDREKVVA